MASSNNMCLPINYITLCLRKFVLVRRETIESLAFIHIFSGQISQDSNATSAVILDIVEELKERNDSVGKVHFKRNFSTYCFHLLRSQNIIALVYISSDPRLNCCSCSITSPFPTLGLTKVIGIYRSTVELGTDCF
jgi:hypothetical protein